MFAPDTPVLLHIIFNTSLARSEHHHDLHLGQAPGQTIGHRQERTVRKRNHAADAPNPPSTIM
jgi:hypothetical protein